jgi:hypothetical protein
MTPLYWAAYALINTALALFGLHILARGVGRFILFCREQHHG